MATTEAKHYFLGHVATGGRVVPYDRLEAGGAPPRHWGVRLRRFWPANRPGRHNDPWNDRSSVGRDRAALSLRVAPLLHQKDDLEAAGIAVFDVHTRSAVPGFYEPVSLDVLLPAKVRAADGLLIQADLVDVSLFLTMDRITHKAGRLTSPFEREGQRWDLGAADPVSLFVDLGGRVLESLWHSVIQPTGIDARAWDPHHARFRLHGPSLDDTPQARAGRYVLAGCWKECDWSGARYSEAEGLRLAGEEMRVPANVLEFELLALRGE